LQLFAEKANGRVVNSLFILFSHLLPQADVFELFPFVVVGELLVALPADADSRLYFLEHTA
jgi:hypothetical protein